MICGGRIALISSPVSSRTFICGITADLSLGMEFDCFQPYFFDRFDAEEDFYKSTAPSEDIWKKFELLPTPPMSPHRTLSGAALYLSPGDQLSWLTKMLGQDEDCEGHFLPDTEELLDNLSAHIIQDCMWSGSPGSKQQEKVGGRVCGTSAPGRPSKTQCASPGGPPSAPADCVDPAAVLTFPAGSSCRKPASSGSESRSDSSGKDTDVERPTLPGLTGPLTMGYLGSSRGGVIQCRASHTAGFFYPSCHKAPHASSEQATL